MSWRSPRDINAVTESAEAAAARLQRDVRHARRAVLVGAASVALFWSLIVVLPDRLPAVVIKLVLVPLAVAAIVGLVAAPVLYVPAAWGLRRLSRQVAALVPAARVVRRDDR
jgi:small-conductance mechanosensitive channel